MLDRRAFLIAGGSQLALIGARHASAQVAPAATTAASARVKRRAIRGMSWKDPDLVAFRRAVERMRALPQSDPRNWTRFADIHRNNCPHGNWYFLPWHRAYIRSFERICQDLSGDPNFALPYWNWTADRRFPAQLEAGDESNNPLLHSRPGVTADFQLTDDMVGGKTISRIMQSPDFEAFGNTRPRKQTDTSAQWQQRAGSTTELEFNPHASVHQAVGGNMAITPLAARDPVFYLHHANIDRLWSAWNARGNANSSEPIWRDFSFDRQFIQPDGSAWKVGVADLGSTAPLGYRYDDDDTPFAADLVEPLDDLMTEKLRAYRELSSRDGITAGPGLRRFDLPAGGTIHVAAIDNDQVATRDRPIAVSIPLGRPLRDILGPQAFAYRPDRPELKPYRRYVWAVLRDLEPPLDSTTRVRVFCNTERLNARTRLDTLGYTTSLSFFGGRHAGHFASVDTAVPGVSMVVDLTPTLARMDDPQSLRADQLTVQLMPDCDNDEANVANIRPRRVELVIL